jgi:hypothetical protein
VLALDPCNPSWIRCLRCSTSADLVWGRCSFSLVLSYWISSSTAGWMAGLQPRCSQVPVIRCMQWRSGDGRSTVVVLLRPRRHGRLDGGACATTISAATMTMLPTRCLPRAPTVSSPLVSFSLPLLLYYTHWWSGH